MNAGGEATKKRFANKQFRKEFSKKMSRIVSDAYRNEEFRKRHLEGCKRAQKRPSWIKNVRASNCNRKPAKNWLTSKEGRVWSSNRMKRLWKTKDGRRKLNHGEFLSKEARKRVSEGAVKGLLKRSKPTKPELVLKGILKKYFPGCFSFNVLVGRRIGGKVPDFIDQHEKVVVEMFGTYWHGKGRVGRTKRVEEAVRRLHFSDYGFRTIIVWQNELQNVKLVVSKVITGLVRAS